MMINTHDSYQYQVPTGQSKTMANNDMHTAKLNHIVTLLITIYID